MKCKLMLKDDRGTIVSEFEDKKNAILWTDNLLSTITREKFNLMSELNDIQSDENGETVFPSKFTIPLRIINLFLKDYNMYLKESKV